MLLISLQSYKLAPTKKTTWCKLKTILRMSQGLICNCHIYCVDTPQSCESWFPVWIWANDRSSLVQGHTQPIRCQLNSCCGVAVWGASLCCHREKCENRQDTLNHIVFGHEDFVKTKLFIKFMKRTRPKLSITIENFKISQLEKELELPKVRLKSEIIKSYFTNRP